MSFSLGEKMAKRSRKARKQQIEKRLQKPTTANVAPQPVKDTPVAPVPQPANPVVAPGQRKIIDFAEEYYYVYSELRNIVIISVVMFALMFGLGFFI